MPRPASAPALHLQNVTKSYRQGDASRPVLSGLDLTVNEGELVVLLGRSGSGKSTLLHLISGIDLPDAGRVEVAGRDLATLTERERTLFRRHEVGFVFQFFHLLPTLTVEENLLLPLELAGRDDAAGRQRARDLLAEVGLGDRGGDFPDRLSGGEQQRVAVARALAHDPSILLADEPTGNLDAETGDRVLELLDRLTRQAGKTLVAVTHSRRVAELADRVYRLEGGRLTAATGAAATSGAELGDSVVTAS